MFKFFIFSTLISTAIAQQNDPNIIIEGDVSYVTQKTCLNHGGQVTRNHRIDHACEGGKYDGYRSTGKATSCSLELSYAQEYLETAQPDEENEWLTKMSESAILTCTRLAKNWPTLAKTLKSAKKSCDEAANQGLSELYRSTCYIKAAQLADFILQK